MTKTDALTPVTCHETSDSDQDVKMHDTRTGRVSLAWSEAGPHSPAQLTVITSTNREHLTVT